MNSMTTKVACLFALRLSLSLPRFAEHFFASFFFLFFFSVLSRVLLCKLLSDRDNQINRPKRSSDKAKPIGDPPFDLFVFLLRAFASSREKNKFTRQRPILPILIASHRFDLFRVCIVLQSGFSNGRESRITM